MSNATPVNVDQYFIDAVNGAERPVPIPCRVDMIDVEVEVHVPFLIQFNGQVCGKAVVRKVEVTDEHAPPLAYVLPIGQFAPQDA